MPETKPTMSRGRFRANTAYHQMTVLHDDGLYRHLRFMRPKPGSSSYWFDLITWPGHLTVDGDCGTYTFARAEDMFGFFRGDHGINPGYWAEKIRNGHGNPQDSARSYSEDVFRKTVSEYIEDAAEEWPGLAKDIAQKFYGSLAEYDITSEDEARRALNEYEYGASWTAECSLCGTFAKGLTEWAAGQERITHTGHGHTVTVARADGFRFYDAWEWNLAEWDWMFLWCCHAIQWGIGQYDAAKAPAGA